MWMRILKVILGGILLEILFFGYCFFYVNYKVGIPCLFDKITGYLCPGCGITRCLLALIRGELDQAFNYNKLVFIMLPFIIVYLFYRIYLYVFDKKDKILKNIPSIFSYILLGVVILFGILRNIW